MVEDRFFTPPLQSVVQIVPGGTETSGATRAPLSLASLASGTLITGTVAGRDDKGNPILRTPQGDVTLHSSHFLQVGSKVALRVEISGGQFQARILSVDGIPIEQLQNPSLDDITDVVVTRGNTSGNNPTRSNASTPQQAQQTQEPVAYNRPPPDVLQKQVKAQELSYQNLDKGSIVTARLARAEPGALEVLRSNFLAAGKAVDTLPPHLDSGAVLTVRVLSNQPPAPYTPPSAGTQTAAPAGGNAPAPAAPTAPQSGPFIPPDFATTPAQVRTASATPTATQTLLVTPEGTPATAQSQGLPTAAQTTAAPAAGTQAAPATVTATTAGAPQATPQANTTTTTTLLPASATPQTTATALPAAAAEILSSAAAPATPAAPAPSTAASTTVAIPATLAGTDATTGERIALTPLGALRLPADITAPPNTKITVQVLSATQATSSYAATTEAVETPVYTSPVITSSRTTPATLPELATRWDSLQELLVQLQTQHPQLASHLLQNVIPRADASLTSSILFFMVALGSGDVRKWVGQDIRRVLEDPTNSNLMQRLGAEFGSIRQSFQQTPGQQWQTLLFPVYDGQVLQQARMFIKRDQEDGSKKDGKKRHGGTRMVMEVNLSQMGEVQLDGLYKEQKSGRSFDLMVRSLRGLAEGVKREITQIFKDSLKDSTIAGTVNFQTTPQFPFDPMSEVGVVPHAPIVV